MSIAVMDIHGFAVDIHCMCTSIHFFIWISSGLPLHQLVMGLVLPVGGWGIQWILVDVHCVPVDIQWTRRCWNYN